MLRRHRRHRGHLPAQGLLPAHGSATVAAALAWALVLGAGCGDEAREGFSAQPEPALGATRFVSAAAAPGASLDGPTAAPPTDDRDESGARTIVEGDIYRALDPSHLVNLNAYRGLQVIDVADPSAPAVVGSLRLAGSPLELYTFDDRAVVVMNDWYGYAHDAGSGYVKEQGGVLILVDLADPRTPVVLDRVVVPGHLAKTRLARGARIDLYVAAALWQLYDSDGATATPVASGDRTVLRSFTVDGDTLRLRDEVDLGGAVSDIATAGDALIIARSDSVDGAPRSRVAVVDIGAEDGTMRMGADVIVAGRVRSQFDVHLSGDVLRVVSEGWWSDTTPGNHFETFDVSDIAHPSAIDHETFGVGESLFATLFVGADRAFFVTYLRQDPFHAFSIAPDGHVTEELAFVVSGWNDFFHDVFAGSRLVGVGIDDADGGRDVAVSLYDITDLRAPDPLVARAHLGIDGAWSEASWDHRAFTVLENAIAVPAAASPDTLETGLVLLPWSGWSDGAYRSGVRLFTFSPTTVTARGDLVHDAPVRRGLALADDVAGCLSDAALSLHDIADPDAPTTLGAVALAPSYPDIAVFGAHAVRTVEAAYWDWGGRHAPPDNRGEVIALDGDPDRAPPVASFDIGPGAGITKVGDLAVALSGAWVSAPADPSSWAWETRVAVWDLATPTAPRERGTLITRALPADGAARAVAVADDRTPSPAGPTGAEGLCVDCAGAPSPVRGTVVGEAVVFLAATPASETAGTQERCVTSLPDLAPSDPVDPARPEAASSADATPPAEEGTYYRGGIECVRAGDGPATCHGAIYACTGLDVTCVEVADPAAIGARTTCVTEPVVRYWTRYTLHVLDLSDPDHPAVGAPLPLADEEEGVGLVAAGDTLWVATREPFEVGGDERAYVRYYARPIVFADARAPLVGARVNVPGALVAVAGDDLFTIDAVYADDHVASALARSRLGDGIATLVARRRYEDRQVRTALLDPAGNLLVSHGPVSWWYGYGAGDVAMASDSATWESRLDVLDRAGLEPLGSLALDTWASLRGAAGGDAIFEVPGGILLVDVHDPGAPTPRGFFATAGWLQSITVAARRVYAAAGPYGLYALGLGDDALLPPE